ncbi:MAG TPA: sulfate adenylyltransferase subunit CysD [Alphaproteobacteria bacterium]|nr:sulfate adenylyltransferase subunit CysD [Alphaproteobacteria bacterium]
MDALDALADDSMAILREAYATARRPALLWSMGKDSNVMLWLARQAFFGRVPFPVVHVDTGLEFAEIYAFRDRLAEEWRLDLIVAPCPPLEAMDPSLPPNARSASRKTAGLRDIIAKRGFDVVIAAIRRDEQGTRAKERVFSPRGGDNAWNFREQPPEFWGHFALDAPPDGHLRVHPLLGWSELDVWRYVARQGVPVPELYFAKNGARYRSLGERDITVPIPSAATTIEAIIAELETSRQPERAGRTMDHEAEDAFERLRAAGYM